MMQRHVGTTLQGIAVYFDHDGLGLSELNVQPQDFADEEDCFDAHAIYEALAYQEFRTVGFGPMFKAYISLSSVYQERLGDNIDILKADRALQTSMDLLDYGKAMLSQVCVDRGIGSDRAVHN